MLLFTESLIEWRWFKNRSGPGQINEGWLVCVGKKGKSYVLMLNTKDRPNTTPTVRAICTFAIYFLVFRPFSRFSLVYEGH